MQRSVGGSTPSKAPGERSTPSALGQGLQAQVPAAGALSVSNRVAAAATAAAAAAAATAAARAEATAATARRYLQPWVLVDRYSKWRHLDQDELKAWQAKGESIFKEHLLPYVPSDISPAVAAVEADLAAAGAAAAAAAAGLAASAPGSSAAAAAAAGSGNTPASGRAAHSTSAAAAAAAAASGTNRFTSLFGVPAASHLSAAALSHHPWTAAQVRDVLRVEIWAGVPDAFKCCVFIHSNDALHNQQLHPTLYRQVQLDSFGPPPFPGSEPGRCPTFSGGLLGLEEDVCGVQTTLNQLELDGDAPLATWRSAPDDLTGRNAGNSSRPARVRLPHPYFPGISSPGSRTHGRTHGMNPLGQRLRHEFNFWPDTSRRAAEAEEVRQLQEQQQIQQRKLQKQQMQRDRVERNKQEQKRKLYGRRQAQKQRQQQQDADDDEEEEEEEEEVDEDEEAAACAAERQQSIEELLTYIGPNNRSTDPAPATAARKAKAGRGVKASLWAARRWSRRAGDNQASRGAPRGAPPASQLPRNGASEGPQGSGNKQGGPPPPGGGGGGGDGAAGKSASQPTAGAAGGAGGGAVGGAGAASPAVVAAAAAAVGGTAGRVPGQHLLL
ncbi:LOW QUALITY PROTEIN: TLD domain-containing protein, putative [Eimeria mitis]|uniref:TLD domain-containing protein, putative n=1 Tax=Eimeria mitis TaxID=44415 RepID=U6KC20_9EIME|nr:LOW QUALITY PROTEIN: TLD domain-containing protein, putative [Eimeria mitis]CDJ33028.1 TLD domain-containing protein, putative [Eimeria mitis]